MKHVLLLFYVSQTSQDLSKTSFTYWVLVRLSRLSMQHGMAREQPIISHVKVSFRDCTKGDFDVMQYARLWKDFRKAVYLGAQMTKKTSLDQLAEK